MTGRPRLLSRLRASARGAPFAALAALAFVTVLLPPLGPKAELELIAAAVLAIAIGAAALVVPWQRLPSWTYAVPPLACFGVIALLRGAEGGAASGFGPLVLLPVVWLALYGSRRELMLAVALAFATFAVPTALVGEPGYPPGEWRRAILSGFTALAVGLAVQRLVVEIRERALTQSTVARFVRELPSTHGARRKVCEVVSELSGARQAILLECDARGELSATAAAGDRFGHLALADAKESAVYLALTSSEPFFFPDVRDHPPTARLTRPTGARSAFFQPVVHDDDTVGVIAVLWQRRVARLDDRVATAVSLLASEAAVAIGRSDLLQRLEEQAQTDSLTGLPNRRVWSSELPREISRSRRTGKPLSIALIDLDRFKDYNDSRGHPAGDRLLKEAAAAWKAELRDVDLLARTGGDEFNVFLHECGDQRAREVMERVSAATPLGQTCSVGIASWRDDEDFERLATRADAALYEAKRDGRDRLAIANANANGDGDGDGRSGGWRNRGALWDRASRRVDVGQVARARRVVARFSRRARASADQPERTTARMRSTGAG